MEELEEVEEEEGGGRDTQMKRKKKGYLKMKHLWVNSKGQRRQQEEEKLWEGARKISSLRRGRREEILLFRSSCVWGSLRIESEDQECVSLLWGLFGEEEE